MATTSPSSSPRYSNCKANLMLSSGIIQQAWACISGTTQQAAAPAAASSLTNQFPFRCREYSKSMILVFNDALPAAQGVDGSSSSSPLVPVDRSGPFGFLITDDNRSISLHRSALSCFNSLLPAFKDQFLPYLQKPEEDKRRLRPLVLVGQSLWGSVAALFTLWLLNNRHSKAPRPMCITFGSPFIGDEGLAKAISKYEQWKAGLWHVLRLYGDDFQRISTSIEQQFRPSGSYFLFSELGFLCLNDPDSVLELLQHGLAGRSTHANIDYDHMVMLALQREGTIHGEGAEPGSDGSRSAIGVVPQLAAMGIKDDHPAYASIAKALEVEGGVRQSTPSSRALNQRKKFMAKLEWYKKTCEGQGMTYYDAYRRKNRERKDMDVQNKMMRPLMIYWKEEVQKAENKPRTPDFPFRDTYLFAGTNYRRLVEPLSIADHYRKGDQISPYMTDDKTDVKRDRHFEKLEEWERMQRGNEENRDSAASLTEDSCFWARVEEAIRSLRKLNEGVEGAVEELQEFVNYVMEEIGRLALSPEVFLKESTFMKWWKEYDQKCVAPDSPFTKFMKEGRNHHPFYSPQGRLHALQR